MPSFLEYERPQRRRFQLPQLRWWIAGMLFLAATLNYIDRQTLSILAPTIQKDLHISEIQYGYVANLFLVAYTLSLLLSGRLVDKLGTRLSLALFITWWSLSNMLTGWARSLGSLGIFRFMLGLGEAGNWPAATKAVSEWFPPKERGVAIGFYTMGATIGATVAPWIIIHVAMGRHWQSAFAFTGALGLIWVIPWLLIYRTAPASPSVEADATAAETAQQDDQAETRSWAAVLSRTDVWLLAIARTLTDPVWFFYQFWFAKYLFSVRHVAQGKLNVTTFIYLAADVGSLLGGLASGWLIRRGGLPAGSRLRVMAVCAALVPLSPLVAFAPSLWVSLAIGMIVVFAHMCWLINISAMLVDLIPKRLVATAFGVVAAGSALGGIAMNSVVAGLVTHYSYTYWFVIAAFLHPVAWLLLAVWMRSRRRSIADRLRASTHQSA